METVDKSRSKGRSQADKIGRHKYNQQLLKRVLHEIQEVKLMQRTILAGLKGTFHFQKPLMQKIACVDELDSEILELLYESGGSGVLPKDLASRLSPYRIGRHQISRRVVRMNKRLEKEIGEKLVEKHGWHWVLTSWAIEVWGDGEVS